MRWQPDDVVRLPYQGVWSEAGVAAVLQMGPRWLPYLRGRWDARLRRLIASQAGALAAAQFLAERRTQPRVLGPEPALPTLVRLQWGAREGWLVPQWVASRKAIEALQQGAWESPQALVPWRAREALAFRRDDLFLFVAVLAWEAPRRRAAEGLHPVRPVFWMPRRWQHPPQEGLNPLVVKAERALSLRMYGLDSAGREKQQAIALRQGQTLRLSSQWRALHALETFAWPRGRLGLKRGTHTPLVIVPRQWANLWLYGRAVWLLGFLTWRDFWRQARYLRRGQVVFPQGRLSEPVYAVPWQNLLPPGAL